MRSLASRRPIGAFLLFVYLWGAVAFALPLLSDIGLGVVPVELPGVAPFVVLAAIGLVVAGFLVSRWAGGRSEMADYRRRVFHFGVNPLWYLLALILLPLTGLITVAAVEGMAPLRDLIADPDLLLTAVLITALVAFVVVNWWEEAGWTGFLLERLQPRFGPVWASVLTTFAQAAVHLPLVFVVDGVTDGRVAAADIPLYLGLLFILPIPVRMIITWIYNATGRSVPVVGLFHAGLGVATGADLIPVIAPGFNQIWVYAGFAVVAVAVLALSRGRLGYQGRASEPIVPATPGPVPI